MNEIHCYNCIGIALNGFLHILWIRFIFLLLLFFLESFVHFHVQELFRFFLRERTLRLFISAWEVLRMFLQWMAHKNIQIVSIWVNIRKIMKHVCRLTSNRVQNKMTRINTFFGCLINERVECLQISIKQKYSWPIKEWNFQCGARPCKSRRRNYVFQLLMDLTVLPMKTHKKPYLMHVNSSSVKQNWRGKIAQNTEKFTIIYCSVINKICTQMNLNSVLFQYKWNL